VVAQRLEHHPHVHEVLLARLGEDEDVVAVDLDEARNHDRGGCGQPEPRCVARLSVTDLDSDIVSLSAASP
jgi:hypothetical protein